MSNSPEPEAQGTLPVGRRARTVDVLLLGAAGSPPLCVFRVHYRARDCASEATVCQAGKAAAPGL